MTDEIKLSLLFAFFFICSVFPKNSYFGIFPVTYSLLSNGHCRWWLCRETVAERLHVIHHMVVNAFLSGMISLSGIFLMTIALTGASSRGWYC